MNRPRTTLLAIALFALTTSTLLAAVPDSSRFSDMRWRSIGPFRGGRTVAAVGVPGQPNVFYIGVNDGGVWKTNDFGRVWKPIFDREPTGSIGAIAVAPSNSDVVYVGSGEGLQRPDLSTGDGIYKSTDAGRTWTHLGLRDGQQIPMIAVDPKDPDRLFVAVLGHPYGPNAERGIFRSTDGSRTFQKVLYRDEYTGGMDVAIDPSNPDVVYAVLWQAANGPWEDSYFHGPGSGLYKSTDGGTTWKQLTSGLPGASDGLGRIGIEIARANPNRLYAIVGAKTGGGVYRSDDAGMSWQRVNDDHRLWGRDGDFNEIRSDPKNPDVVYVANVVTWKSTDGGKTFASFHGAPGGDDYHRIWINPSNPDVILIAADQGAIVTVNGGETWSSWYNQPTAQFYHVSTDDSFPYRVCGGQQESGSACVQSRSDDGQITFREWHPVAVEEYGYAVPDPLDPDIVYGGRISRYDRRTDQAQNVSPKPLRGDDYRVVRTQPIAFSPVDPHTLYFASNTLWKTTDGGRDWTEISPDLTRKTWAMPASVGAYAKTDQAKVTRRGVIYAIAPSPLDVNLIWAGTDDGLIHVTTDGGKTWKNVTPPQLGPWWKVSIMDASHFDRLTAYAAINTFRLDDLRPHIFRTHDGGKSWTEITSGIPDGGAINVVREDPKTKGLLFAGSEQAVYVSFDDGDHWQPLRLNMPATSIRDLVIHGDDLVVGTHGRGFWILDDITPLRQIAAHPAAPDVELYEPQVAMRFRWDKWPDTPLPPEEPAGQNPPEGAIIDYFLKTKASGPVTLDIFDADGAIVRHYASTDEATPPRDTGQVPWYWIRPPRVLSGDPGMHRFTWDMHLPPVPGLVRYPISAIYKNTAPAPTSPWVMPGDYSVRLTVDGKSFTQPLTVVMDPRVKTSREGLARQFELSMHVYDDLLKSTEALAALRSASRQANQRQAHVNLASNDLALFARKASRLAGVVPVALHEEDENQAKMERTLTGVSRSLGWLLWMLQQADVEPTPAQVAEVGRVHGQFVEVMKKWSALKTTDLGALNQKLERLGIPTIEMMTTKP